jgi:MSHA biogenesis protein MshP
MTRGYFHKFTFRFPAYAGMTNQMRELFIQMRLQNPVLAKQRGFSLISAIFLLVVIAALGTFAVTLSTTQQHSAALDVLGARGFQASRAGVEWGAYQVLPASAAAFASTCRSAGSNNQAGIPLPATLASFSVSVGCTATSAVEDASTLWIYQINSVATTPGIAVGEANYVERQMSVTIAQ